MFWTTGRLTDGPGRVVDFKNTLIILTSTSAASSWRPEGRGEDVESVERRDEVVRGHSAPEFLNRLDESFCSIASAASI